MVRRVNLLPSSRLLLTVLGIAWCSASAAGQSTGSLQLGSGVRSPFVTAPAFNLPSSPTSVAVGDLNGDGTPDLVVTRQGSGSVTVLLGDGRGSFGAGVEYPAGTQPGSVQLADLKRDGRLDVVVTDSATGSVDVLFGRGDGTLGKPAVYAAIKNPVGIALGSFRGNGNIDIAVASAKGLVLLLNDDSGHFSNATTVPINSLPLSMTAADLKGSGHDDLVLANHDDLVLANEDGTVTILLGDGTGRVRAQPAVAAGSGPLSSVLAADLNGDGKPDLVVTQANSDKVTVLLGRGDGTFQSGVAYTVGNGPAWVIAADLDGDGTADLVTVNRLVNTFSVLLGNGDGTFRPSLDFVAGNVPVAAVAGNFYGNGHVDLAIINHASQTLTVPRGNGDGTFKAARSYVSGPQPVSIASGILNGGKIPGLVVANYCGSDPSCATVGNVAVFLPDKAGAYQLSSTYPVGAGPVTVALADVNEDKNLDIIAANRLDKTVTVMLGVGDGTFRQPVTFPLAGSPIALAVGTLQKGGKPGLAVLEDCGAAKCAQPGSVEVLAGTGDGNFQSLSTYPVGYSPSSLAIGDINGDKNLDIVVANRCGADASCQSPGSASVLLGDGTGKFTPGTDIALGNSPASIALGNLTGSGLDLAVSRSADNTVAVLHGNGDGTFQAAVAYPVGNQPGSLVVADFNGDGKADVAVANVNDSTVSVLFGKGDGTLQPATAFAVGSGPIWLTVVGSINSRHSSLATANGNTGSSSPGTEFTVLPNLQTDPPLASFALAALPTPTSSVNDSVLLTATLTGVSPNAAPTGTVTFDSDPGTGPAALPDCTGVIVTQGVSPSLISTATCTTHMLTAGSDALTAVYSGDTIYDTGVGETSPAVAQTVAKLSPSLTFLATAPSSSTSVNQAVTFSAALGAVAFTPITPTNTVNFTAGTAPATTISGCGAQALVLTAGAWTASCTTNALVVGNNQTIGAVYAGDANFATATAPTITQTVNAANTTTTLASSANPSSVDQQVTFTATVAPASGTANVPITGNVAFKDGATTLCASSAVSLTAGSYTATCATSSLTATGSPYSITAAFTATGTNYNNSQTASALSQTVNAEGTTTTLASSVNPSSVDQQVTFTATVAPASGTATTPITGNVAFKNGAATLCAASALSLNAGSYTATCATSSLTAAASPYSITAAFTSGDTNYSNSQTTTPLSQTVNAEGTTTTLVSSLNPSIVDQQVTFTATVAPASGTATTPIAGAVAFKAGATTLCASSALSLNAGTYTATCATSSLTAAASPNPISATFNPSNANYSSSQTATPLSQKVTAAATSVVVTALPATPTLNQAVTLTATLGLPAGATVVPDGTFAFTDNATTLTGCGSVSIAYNSTAKAYQATCPIASFSGGGHLIVATYANDLNYSTSFGNLSLSLSSASTTTTISSSANPSTVNQAVTFTVNVQGGTSIKLTGTATVTADSTNALGQCTLVWNSTTGIGTCTVSAAALSKGTHSITANYSGDSNYNASNGTLTPQQVVNAGSTTLLLSSSANPSTVNLTVVFTATLTFTSGSTPLSGTMAFTDNGTTISTCAAVSPSAAGVATCSDSSLSAAGSPHKIVATYSNDTNFTGSTNSLTQTVSNATISVAVSSSANPSSVNQTVTFTANITAPSGGTPLSGTVAFTDNGAAIAGCSAVAPSASGAAGCPDAVLTAVGSPHTIVATYAGDKNFTGGNATLSPVQVVNPAATSLALSSSLNPSAINKPVSFTATITFPAGSTALSGTVTFNDTSTSPATQICLVIPTSAGVAVCTTASLSLNTHQISATYGNDSNFQSSTSNTVSQKVGAASTTTAISTSTPSSTVNQSVTFTATVSGATGNTPYSGTMAFTDDNVVIGGCGSRPVNATSGVATCTTAAMLAGSSVILATYGNDNNFAASSATLTISVGQAASTVVLASSLNPSFSSVANTNNYGDTVVFTATVTPFTGAVPLAGTVTISDNGLTICSKQVAAATGVAACSDASWPTGGSHTILAAYGSDPNYLSNNSSISQTVEDYSLTLASVPSTVVVTQGFSSGNDPFAPVTVTVTSTSIGGFATATGSPLALTCSVSAAPNLSTTGATLPTCSLASSTLPVTSAPQNVTVTIQATNASAGTYLVTAQGTDPTSGLVRSTLPLTFAVVPASSPLTVISGATTNNSGNVSFILPAGVSLTALKCASIAGTGIATPLPPSDLFIGCSFNPATIASATSLQTGTTAVTVTTTNLTSANLVTHGSLLAASLLGIPIFGLIGLLRGRKSPASVFFRILAILAISAAAWQVMGCGGSFQKPTAINDGQTPPGAYDLLIQGTGSDGNTYESVLHLNVTL